MEQTSGPLYLTQFILTISILGGLGTTLIWGIKRVFTTPLTIGGRRSFDRLDKVIRRLNTTATLDSDDKILLHNLKSLNPYEFEQYVASLFEALGCAAKVVGGPHDGGVDLRIKHNGRTDYVQCKKFITQFVTVGQMRDFYGSIVDGLGAGRGYFITTGFFSIEARNFGRIKNLVLLDGKLLAQFVRAIEAETGTINYPMQHHSIPASCPRCHGALHVRYFEKRQFVGCTNYPTCTYSHSLWARTTVPKQM